MIEVNGYYYVGSTNDFPSRWSSHLTLLMIGKHHSPELQDMWNKTRPEEWTFRIIKYISKTELRKKTGLKGKEFDDYYRKHLLMEEKLVMNQWSINYCLNKNKRNFQ